MHERVRRGKEYKGLESYGKNDSIEEEQSKRIYPSIQNIIQ
jgi:hypothetical protein